jgi:NTE family protein
MRFLARRIGVLEPNGAGVLSYLLFESGYCRRLINLGFADAAARRVQILSFLGHEHSVDERPSQPQVRPSASEPVRNIQLLDH